MKSWLVSIISVACLALFAGGLPNTATADDAVKPMAVWFYADWCPNCKKLAPKYEQARQGFEDKIQFVTLDVTNSDTKVKASKTAGALRIAPLYYDNQATGWVALLDSKRNKVGELHSDESVEDMQTALSKLVQSP